MTEEKKSFLDRVGGKKSSPIEKKDKPVIAPKAEEDEESPSHLNRGKNSFMDNLIRSSTDRCFQVMGRDTTGETAWYFILVDKEKKEQFLAHKPGDSYDLADYGKIIASGYGDSVPEETKAMLKEKYNFDNF